MKKAETKFGKVCEKHPELNGLQIAKTRWCSACSKERAAAYYQENKERLRKEHREYARKNKESNSARGIAWAKANKEIHAERAAKWRKDNSEKALSFTRNWALNNPHICAERESKKRLINKKATPKWANKFFITEAYHLSKLREISTGFKWHVDHIVPMVSNIVCGLHTIENLMVIPATLNMSKGNRYWQDMPEGVL